MRTNRLAEWATGAFVLLVACGCGALGTDTHGWPAPRVLGLTPAEKARFQARNDAANKEVSLGWEAMKEGDLASAERHMRIAEKADPNDGFYAVYLGRVLEAEGKLTEAVYWYKKVALPRLFPGMGANGTFSADPTAMVHCAELC
jgi:tetratricopeptide (TPR) repeat protein